MGQIASGGCGSYYEDEMQKAVEERVRTHMIAGHTAKDLTDSELSCGGAQSVLELMKK